MSLSAICSGNFNQLWNSIGNSCGIKLLRNPSRLIYKTVLYNEIHSTILISTRILARNARSASNQSCRNNRKLHSETVESSNKVLKQSDFQHIKSLQCYNLQEKGSGVKTEWPATILIFDIETTGFSRQNDRIIEFALRDLMGGKNSTFQTLINPEKDVRNADIHGISTSMVRRPDVPRFEEVIPILVQYVRSHQMAGKPILWVAHNGRTFDVPFLINEFRRCNMEIPEDWRFVDSLFLAKQLVDFNGAKLSSVKLDNLREHYKIPLTGSAHRAMQDVTTLCYVFQKMTFDLKLTVPQLLDKSFRASDIAKPRPEK